MDIPQSEGVLLFARLIFWGAIILVLFILQRIGLPFLIKNQDTLRKYRQRIKIAELVVWLVFLTWFIFRFLDIRSLFALVPIILLLALLFVVFRYWLSEIVSGLIFRSTKQLNTGDQIELQELSGIIKSFDRTSIQVENRDGKIIYIPYTHVINKPFTKSESTKQSSGYTIEIKIQKPADIDQTIERIKREIVALPWSSVHTYPKVAVAGQTSGNYILKVTYYAIENSFAGKIENHLKQTFG
jgi:small-conductance mechanosensitive channel